MSERDFRYANRRPHRRRGQGEGQSNLLVQLGRALGALWRLIVGKKSTTVDRVRLLALFAECDQLTGQGSSGAAQAVVRADSLLDEVMRAAGGSGTSFSDRLRSLERRFDRNLYQQVWDAHKLRNEIAHEHPNVSAVQASQVVSVFRRAASQLGAF